MKGNVIEHLQRRGLIDAVSSEGIGGLFARPTKVYAGFDPTASSLHLGNLIGIMVLAHFQRFGHTPVIVLGGATGRIGDPSGTNAERPLLEFDTIRQNVDAIRLPFERVLDFSGALPKPLIFDNERWYHNVQMIDFLRDVGKYFRLGSMLAKETVKSRLGSKEGISYTEFSYQIIQAFDFYYLHAKEGVMVQIGGSDQWGNITAGIELTRKKTGRTVYGLTWPLLKRSDGKKFGKTAAGAVWLNAEKCSPYQLYQSLYRIPDADVIGMLKVLTFLELDEIAVIEREMCSAMPNSAQKRLAQEVTRMVHGQEGLRIALKVTGGAAPGRKAPLDASVLEAIAEDMPSLFLNREEVMGKRYADLAVLTGLATSKGEANRLIKNGGGYFNNQKLTDGSYAFTQKDLIDGAFLMLGAGKKRKVLIKVL